MDGTRDAHTERSEESITYAFGLTPHPNLLPWEKEHRIYPLPWERAVSNRQNYLSTYCLYIKQIM